MKSIVSTLVPLLLLLVRDGSSFHRSSSVINTIRRRTIKAHAPPGGTPSRRSSVTQASGGGEGSTVAGSIIQDKRGVYWDKPLLRGEFHRAGALLYPPLLGLPLILKAGRSYRLEALLFSLAVEGILVVSATLHTFPWRREKWHQVFRKMDFAMIFVGIALFYSSIGKLLFTTTTTAAGNVGAERIFSSLIEPLVWMCAAVGVVLKSCFPNAPPWLNSTIFLIQGWACGPLVPALFRTASLAEATGLVLGGIFITLGATAYSLQWPNGHKKPLHDVVFGPHEMFHVGTLGMFVSFWFSMFMRVTR